VLPSDQNLQKLRIERFGQKYPNFSVISPLQTMNFFTEIGRFMIFMKYVMKRPQKWSVFWKITFREMHNIGIESLVVVALIAFFLGAVTTIQTANQLLTPSDLFPTQLIPKFVVGSVVSTSAILELAPTITCLVLAGKVGANIASEIGNKKISEQIDAYEVMGINSASFVALPKIIAGLIMIPSLIIAANFLLMTGGAVATKFTSALSFDDLIEGARMVFHPEYVEIMLIKSFIFSFIITSLSSYQGYYTEGGALEVGAAGTYAVTRICIFILFFDLVIAQIFLGL
jgi:phospholipid/cholesterol/gamma-HCH transport system permease protein